MGYGLINYSTLKDLANAFRRRLGSEKNLTLQELEETADTIDLSENEAIKSLLECTVTSFVVPDGVTKIAPYLFDHFYNLEEIDLPIGIKELPPGGFSNCSNLARVKLPDDLEKLGNSCFSNCTSLTSITLPNTLKEISDYCFQQTKLIELTIPASVETIGAHALENSELKSITFLGTPKSIDSNAILVSSAIINVPWAEGEVEGAPWGATDSTINYNYSSEVI